MPRGTPDWAQVAPQDLLARVLDDAELAVRLGAASIFDRRGSVVYADDFSHGINRYAVISQGSDTFARISHRDSLLSGYSLRCNTGSTGGEQAGASVSVPLITDTPIGIEALFASASQDIRFNVGLQVHNGTSLLEYLMRWDRNSDDLEVKTGVSTFTDVDTDLDHFVGVHAWAHLKLVIDPAAETYLRGRVGQDLFDLSALSPATLPTTGGPGVAGRVACDSSQASADDGFVGLVVITVNE